ncbi:MAG: phosphoribosylformylglycinamidine synthase I [Candidatus Aenigmatarchaeota archaeon]
MPKALILTGYGINCDYETEFAFNTAGASTKRVHLNDIIDRKILMEDFNILAIPGGFSFGDDIASGKVLGNKMRYNLKNEIESFIDNGKLIIGICNGFQVLVKMGILPFVDFSQSTTLTFNDSGRFEDRWVHLKINEKSKCIFTRGIKNIYLPVRHGEGKFISDKDMINFLNEQNLVAARYVDENGNAATYPWNPNGSMDNIAAISDPSGKIFGLMPHPEGFLHKTNHPRWTRTKITDGEGLQIFRNAVEFIRNEF